MKKVVNSVLVFAIAILSIACGQSENKESAQERNDAAVEQPTEQEAKPAAVHFKDDMLNTVYQHYIHLTTALTNGDAEEAKAAASAIEAAAKEMEGGSEIAGAAAKISQAGDIEAQRQAYSGLSDQLIALVKKSGVESGQLYVTYCPMKQSSWLSNSKQIKNPYYGESMLTCGEVKETIQ